MRVKYYNEWGDFSLHCAQGAPDVYLPLVNEAGMMSSITPFLAGDCKKDQNTFLLPPASEQTLTQRMDGRNFWVKVNGHTPWSVAGSSVWQMAQQHTPQEEPVELEGGLLWQRIVRTWQDTGIQASTLSFVPADDALAEVMEVTLENCSDTTQEISCVAAIPVYGRSADHLRDHRHVTSLLHRGYVTRYGLDVAPTLTFDERGHLPGDITYRVWGADEAGMPPNYCVPLARDFYGDGTPLAPAAVVGTPDKGVCCYPGDGVEGGEMVAALYFAPCTLEPGQVARYQVVLAIDSDPTPYLSHQGVMEALERTQAYWRAQSTCHVDTGDFEFRAWLRWVSIQPVLRRICGCSFLPHHDYGRGGRGWRDLWQDSLALLLSDPQGVREDLLCHFGGVRPDGTNATIIGTQPGEFKADRNNIPRVWMDHGFWPFFTTQLYIQETGDTGFLMEKQPYFNDGFAYRGDGDHPQSTATREGSVLEHLMVQQVTAFFDVGENGHIRLRGADWNDGLDMARNKGESVAFTAAYGGSLCWLAQLVRELEVPSVRLHTPLVKLIQSPFGDVEQMHQALYTYCQEAYTMSGELEVAKEVLADRLEQMGQWIFQHIRSKDWIGDQGELNWFNSYYDDHGKQVEGVFGQQIRMMLTGQVFTILSGAATDEQVHDIARAVRWYLWEGKRGGCALNTDFKEVKTDLGRMFGFAYGTKENGAVFSHMAVMYAYALYSRGLAAEGWQVLNALYHQSVDFDKGHILPGIPEYFDLSGRGMYPYLTGAASWYMLTVRQQMYGIQGVHGALHLEPKLEPEQFDDQGQSSISCTFGGVPIQVVYHNPSCLSYGKYQIKEVYCGDQHVTLPLSMEQIHIINSPIHVVLGE